MKNNNELSNETKNGNLDKPMLTTVFLAPYLPYDIKCQIEHDCIMINEIATGIDTRMEYPNQYILFGNIEGWKFIGDKKVLLSSCKPILRPLSDLTKEIEHKGNKFIPLDILNNMLFTKHSKLEYYDSDYCEGAILFTTNISGFNLLSMNEKIQKLYEWHFDVNKLIEKGLAISIHDVE